jgi:hypothetical protein
MAYHLGSTLSRPMWNVLGPSVCPYPCLHVPRVRLTRAGGRHGGAGAGSASHVCGSVWHQGRALAAEMAALKEEAAAKSAALAALQRDRAAERSELLETQQALAEALEHLEAAGKAAGAADALRADAEAKTMLLDALQQQLAAAEARQVHTRSQGSVCLQENSLSRKLVCLHWLDSYCPPPPIVNRCNHSRSKGSTTLF